jgi:membrane fusion protein, multidrug efflux system
MAVDKDVGISAMSRAFSKTLRESRILMLAAALATAGCSDTSVASNSKGTDPAAMARPAVNSQPAAPMEPLPGANAPDRSSDTEGVLTVLSVEHQVDLSTELDGLVTTIAKDEGSSVKAGEVLGQLDDRTLKLELVKARDDLKVSQNNVLYKQAELKSKLANLDRQKQLRQLGLSSQADLEAADFASKGAEFDLRGWEAQAEASQAEINRIELVIDKTRLRAPFAGVVARRYIREGQTVAKNDKCFRISQLAPLQVQFQLPEAAGRRPELGNLVQVRLVENSTAPLVARIVKIGPTVDPASDSYNITARLLETKNSILRPGMAVRVAWPAVARPTH